MRSVDRVFAGPKVPLEPGSSLIVGTDLAVAKLSNFNRYTMKLPSAAETLHIVPLPDGSMQFSTVVSGSSAVYIKTVDAAGNTIGYTRVTVLPDGPVPHVKGKLNT